MNSIYLDYNATTRTHPDVRRAVMAFLDGIMGNPSSIHAAGRAARDAIERARAEVAGLMRARVEEIVFTSGGTEANNLGVRGGAEAARARDARRVRVIALPLEHPSVTASLETLAARGFCVELLRVDALGRLDLDDAASRLGDDVALVALQLANHEIGNLYPVAELAARARAAGVRVHCDAVQAAGRVLVDAGALAADTIAISAHKIYGPSGSGALVVRGADPAAHTVGGHQERGRRPGTENGAGAVGFGVAARLAQDELEARAAHAGALRDRLEAGLVALGARVNGDRSSRVPNTSNVAWPGLDGETIVQALDLAGVCCSTGAACSSGTVAPSPVLLALGQSKQDARSAVRFSVGRDNTPDEIDRVLAILPPILARLRRA
jgi:cysteine desulfurase